MAATRDDVHRSNELCVRYMFAYVPSASCLPTLIPFADSVRL